MVRDLPGNRARDRIAGKRKRETRGSKAARIVRGEGDDERNAEEIRHVVYPVMPSSAMKASARRLLQIALLVGLFAAPFPLPAAALVGSAREAPEFSPYVVMIVDQRDASYCSASVIDRKVLLTAAHCVDEPATILALFIDSTGERVYRESIATEIHPGYRTNAARRGLVSIDLALVRLAEPLPPSFATVELASSARVQIGQKLTIVGFGIGDETEPKTGGTLREGILEISWSEPPSLIRLRDPNDKGFGACTGDSGAPIFQVERPVVVAVATWAKGEGRQRCGAATQAVLVAPQRNWIDQILRSWAHETGAR
jgi:hypothetical protein